MSSGIVVPVPRAIYLCEGYVGYPTNGLTDLMNVFNALRPQSYPYVHADFVVYARLSGGLRAVQFFVEIVDAATRQLLHLSNTYALHFQRRTQTVEMALTFDGGVSFPHADTYTVDLYLENQWTCDCTLELL